MRDSFIKIINNEIIFSELASKQFSDSTNVTRENVKQVLEQRGADIRRIIFETNELLEIHINPYLANPEKLTRDEAEELQEFAENLSGYKENVDTGLSYDIRNALIKYAETCGDVQMLIKNTFFKGLALFYLDRMLFRAEMSDCYEKVMSYGENYEKYDKDIRNLIVRAYGNFYISVSDLNIDEIFRRYDLAIDFWENRAKVVDPDFPWESYFFNLHENLCSTTITALRSERVIYVKQEHKDRLLDSSKILYGKYLSNQEVHTNDYTTLQVKCLYFNMAAQYHNDLITVNELCDFLYDIFLQADDEYTYDDLYKKLHVSALFLYYLDRYDAKDLTEKDLDSITKRIETDVFRYVMNIPDTLSRQYVTTMLTNFALGSHKLLDDYVYIKMLLSLTVFRHPPTYAHSVMVSKISFTIVEYIIKHHPDKLIGIPSINNVNDVTDKAGDLLLFVWFSGLIHDIGKIVYSHMVSFYVRKLNDKEFEMIKQHSDMARDFIKKSPSVDVDTIMYDTVQSATNIRFSTNPELFACFSDVAFGHHKSFDGKFGYPKDFDNLASPVKTIIDIISIADSIDAATDKVGRSYAREKTLEDMRDDLMSQINTRYCPFVTKLIFENEDLYNQIEDILNNYRYDIYHSCFSVSESMETMLPPQSDLFSGEEKE